MTLASSAICDGNLTTYSSTQIDILGLSIWRDGSSCSSHGIVKALSNWWADPDEAKVVIVRVQTCHIGGPILSSWLPPTQGSQNSLPSHYEGPIQLNWIELYQWYHHSPNFTTTLFGQGTWGINHISNMQNYYPASTRSYIYVVFMLQGYVKIMLDFVVECLVFLAHLSKVHLRCYLRLLQITDSDIIFT